MEGESIKEHSDTKPKKPKILTIQGYANALEKRDAEIKEFDDKEKMRIQKNKDKAEAERLSREGYDRVR